jgi:D-amino-acid dehydrogenase
MNAAATSVPQAQHVCVIGAGIVGSATAYLLAKAGHRVTLLEARDAPGQVTSFANGAQLSYSYVEPLATPATLRKVPSMLLDPDSPLKFRLTGELAQMRWGLQFMAACRQSQVEHATKSLLALSFLSRDELNRAREADDLQFEYAQPGKLVVYADEVGLAGARQQVAYQKQLGCKQTVISSAECLEREPALAACAQHVRGAVWTPGEAVGDAHLLSRALVTRAQTMGAQVRYRSAVTQVHTQGDRIAAVTTARDEVSADTFVLANGADATKLGQQMKLNLPIYPIKGYSITLPIKNAQAAPRISVTDLRRKTVYARLGQQLRIAGMAELVGHDLHIQQERIQFLVECALETFPGACDGGADPQAWVGLRPATPTSMPLLGPTRWRNLLLNVGHGALGLTLAMGSARLLERYVAGAPSVVAQPFAYRG